MKNYFFYFVICCIAWGGCSTASLDTEYNASSREKDYEDLSNQISKEELNLLKDYIHTSLSSNLINYTYREILKDAKDAKEEQMRKKQRKTEEKKLIQQRTELLCNKKWKLKNIEYIVEGTDDSVSAFELTEPALKVFSKNRWKIYTSDGTYQEVRGNKEIGKGNWWFVSPDEIHEARSMVYLVDVLTKEKKTYRLIIDTLDEKQFRYLEEPYSSGAIYASSTQLVTMEGR